MGTHLIIDGYNVLGTRGQAAAHGEAAREQLLRDLARYHQRKGSAVTVVFDGWRHGFGAEHHEHRAGVSVIYSKRGERADQVIQRLASEYGRTCAVVSSDREVERSARAQGAFVLSAAEFESRLREAPRVLPPPKRVDKDDDGPNRPRSTAEKKGNPRKLPKALRQRNRRLRGF